jgi:hypothetical protein
MFGVGKSDQRGGFTFNVNKTKIMVNFTHYTYLGKKMEIGGDMIEVVDEFVHLGTYINEERDEVEDIGERGQADKAHFSE